MLLCCVLAFVRTTARLGRLGSYTRNPSGYNSLLLFGMDENGLDNRHSQSLLHSEYIHVSYLFPAISFLHECLYMFFCCFLRTVIFTNIHPKCPPGKPPSPLLTAPEMVKSALGAVGHLEILEASGPWIFPVSHSLGFLDWGPHSALVLLFVEVEGGLKMRQVDRWLKKLFNYIRRGKTVQFLIFFR